MNSTESKLPVNFPVKNGVLLSFVGDTLILAVAGEVLYWWRWLNEFCCIWEFGSLISPALDGSATTFWPLNSISISLKIFIFCAAVCLLKSSSVLFKRSGSFSVIGDMSLMTLLGIDLLAMLFWEFCLDRADALPAWLASCFFILLLVKSALAWLRLLVILPGS